MTELAWKLLRESAPSASDGVIERESEIEREIDEDEKRQRGPNKMEQV